MHPEPAQRGQREHRGPLLPIGLHEQVSALIVVEWELGQADDEVPVPLAGVVLQSTHRGRDVLGPGGERLAHER